jgi:hypothetical protein
MGSVSRRLFGCSCRSGRPVGEARRRAIAVILGEPDPLPHLVGYRPKPIPLPGKWLSKWMTNRAARRRLTDEPKPRTRKPALSAPFETPLSVTTPQWIVQRRQLARARGSIVSIAHPRIDRRDRRASHRKAVRLTRKGARFVAP